MSVVFFVVLTAVIIIAGLIIGFLLIKQARSILEKGQLALEEALQQESTLDEEVVVEDQVVRQQVVQQPEETPHNSFDSTVSFLLSCTVLFAFIWRFVAKRVTSAKKTAVSVETSKEKEIEINKSDLLLQESAADSGTVLQMFSGGRDSLLAACRLLDVGHSILLVTYDNGCTLYSNHAKTTANCLIEKYGESKISFLTYSIAGVWREFLLPFFNLKSSEILKQYGEITYSQFNCLSCRASMYVYSVALCKVLGFCIISDGARHSQGFAVELDPVLNRFRDLVSSYGIELVSPVLSLGSDWERKNELLRKELPTKVLEPQCLIGVPLPPEGTLDESIVSAVCSFFDQEILPRFSDLVEEVEKEISSAMKSNKKHTVI